MKKIITLLLACILCTSVTSLAQTSLYAEGADISSNLTDPTFSITSAGTYTVSGSLSTPGDGQDYFQVTTSTGLSITNATYSISGGGGFSGGWGFAGCCGNSISGNGSGTFSGASYPLGAGTYGVQMSAGFSVGNSWVVTFTVTGTASTPAPSITSNPPNRTICSGSGTTFSISASNATSYQWQRSTNGGSTYSNVSNGGVFSGATTTTLSISNVAGMNNNRFRCVATGSTSPAATSSHGTLTVNSSPSITSQPSNSSLCSPGNTSFSIAANNASSYQWQLSTNGGSTYNNISNNSVYSGATTTTLAITGATTGMNNYRYRCVASGSCTPATSNAAILNVYNTPPTITSEPTSLTRCSNAPASFTVGATGSSLVYQWEVSYGGPIFNVTNGGGISGATTATLSATTAAALGAGTYRCRVSTSVTGCFFSSYSNQVTLTINSLPAITSQPSNSTICEGSNTSFTAGGSGTLHTFQWEVSSNGGTTWNNVTNGGFYSNATTGTLNVTGANTSIDGYQYRCRVSGTCTPSAVSNPATLTVNTAPAVTTQPVNRIVCEGTNTTFGVTATGTALTYQWQWSSNGGTTWADLTNTGIYSNVTTNTLTLTGTAPTVNGYQYRCRIGGTCSPTATSNPATLTINTAPTVTTQPANRTICSGNNTTFGITATGTALTYQWQWSSNSGATWTNLTNTGIYSNVTTNTLTLTGAAPTVNNYQYRCVVGGTCTPSATSNAAILIINTAPVITTQPTNTIVCDGSNTSLSVAVSGTAPTYQWQISTNSGATWINLTNGAIYSNVTTATLGITSAPLSLNNNQYRCIIGGTCPPGVTSAAATLTVNSLPNVTSHPSASTICELDNTSFSVTATGTAITYQWQWSANSGATWTNLTNGAPYNNVTSPTLNITSAPLTAHNNQYRCVVSGACTPAQTSNPATLTINGLPKIVTHPSNADVCIGSATSMSVVATGHGLTYQWEINTGSGWVPLGNGGVYSNVTSSTLNIAVAVLNTNNNQYRCVVSGTCTPSVTSNAGTLTLKSLPAITTQPSNSSICAGTNTSFGVTATGTAITYQWQWSANSGTTWNNVVNNTTYSGATTNTLALTSTPVSENNNQYRCVVSGDCAPSVTSIARTLVVRTPPVITSQPTNKTVCRGSTTSFTVAATSSVNISYQWQAFISGSWQSLTNGGPYSGAWSNTLTVSSFPGYSSIQYRCQLSTGCTPSATTNTVTLTSNEAPVITGQPSSILVCPGGNTSFTVNATGTGLSYQWQENTGTGWGNVVNGGVYSGGNTNALSISNANISRNGYQYRCVVSGSCPPNVTSSVVTYSVGSVTAITSHPTNKTICTGDNTSLSVSATGTNLTYQWFSRSGGGAWVAATNGAVFSGATSATLSITNLTGTGNEYYCRVTGACGIQNSNTATVTVNLRPTIVNQPVSTLAICDGSVDKIVISASGTSLMYQWQVSTNGTTWSNVSNNSNYSGATTNQLDITAALSLDGNRYRCVVSGACTPSRTSNVTTLTVNPIVTPSVSITSTNVDICAGTNVTFTASGTNGGSSPVYKWHKNGVQVGSNSATYSSTTLTDGDVVYCVLQTNAACPTSVTALSNTIKVKVTQYVTPTVSITSSSGNVECSGIPITFKAAGTNGGTPTYTWQLNGTNVGTNVDSFVTSTLNNGDIITCDYTSDLKCVTSRTVSSNSITMTINKTTFSSIVILPNTDTNICKGDTVSFKTIYTNGGPTPSYQWILNGQDIVGASGATFDISNLKNGDNVQCRFISSALCVFPKESKQVGFTVNDPVKPTVDVTVFQSGNNEFTFQATPTNGGANPSYRWYVAGAPQPNQTTDEFISSLLNQKSSVFVEMTTSLTCVTDKVVTSRKLTTSVTSIAEVFEEIGLYPNPNSGQFTIAGKLNKPVSDKTVYVRVMNSIGQAVFEKEYSANSKQLSLPVNLGTSLANGFYVVNVVIDGQVTNIRFMLNR